MFSIRIGDAKFEIYPLLDANEVIMKMHNMMKYLSQSSVYKTFILDIEKYSKLDDTLIGTKNIVSTYTLIILKSDKYLKPNDIALLFKEMFKKRKGRGMLYGH